MDVEMLPTRTAMHAVMDTTETRVTGAWPTPTLRTFLETNGIRFTTLHSVTIATTHQGHST